MPNDAVDLPLPYPVLTMRSGRSLLDLFLSRRSRGSRTSLTPPASSRQDSPTTPPAAPPTLDTAPPSPPPPRPPPPAPPPPPPAARSRPYPSPVSPTNDAAPKDRNPAAAARGSSPAVARPSV